MLQETSPFIRESFLEHAVQSMSQLLGADLAFVSRVLDMPATRVRVLAAAQGGAHKAGWDFDLTGTPCDLIYDSSGAPLAGAVLRNDGQIWIPTDLRNKFPATRDTSFQTFMGVPLWNRQADMVGHIAVFFEERIQDAAQANVILDIMQVLAKRVEAELDRMVLENEATQAKEDLCLVNAQLLQDSITDPLTQVSNRRYFNHRCKEAFTRFQRADETYFLLLFDVDHFKEVNDRYGHVVGDQALKAIAAILSRNLRQDVEVLARLGGEEFAVVCHGVARVSDAAALADRMRIEMAEHPFDIDGKALQITVSAGIAGPSQQDNSWEDAYRRADQALYAAKANGRNQISVAEYGE